MNKLRKWFFKFLTGYDLVEYEDILNFAAKVNKSSEEVLELASSIHDDNKEILELNRKVIEANERALDISRKTIDDCKNILLFCEKGDVNETLD